MNVKEQQRKCYKEENVNNKVILIMGGTGGIGKEITTYLKPNYKVVISSRTAPFIKGEQFQSFPCNISEHTDLSALLSHILITWGKIDIIINASGAVILKPFLEYTTKDINSIIETNIRGSILLAQWAIQIFQLQKYGRIIHLGSTRSITVAPNKSVYSVSKFALRALNDSINLEFNKDNIYSSLICPGHVDINSINKTQVFPQDINNAIQKIIDLNDNMNIPEIILGGVL